MKLTFSERFRALYQNPVAEVKAMGAVEGEKVADVGAGRGYFTVAAASIVREAGLVYAIEPDPGRSERIRRRVEDEGLANVRVLTTGAERLEEIPTDSIDLAFSAFSLHHFEHRDAGVAEIRRTLRSGGWFYVLDRVPGTITKYGTRKHELEQLSKGFTGFELISSGRTVRAKFTK